MEAAVAPGMLPKLLVSSDEWFHVSTPNNKSTILLFCTIISIVVLLRPIHTMEDNSSNHSKDWHI